MRSGYGQRLLIQIVCQDVSYPEYMLGGTMGEYISGQRKVFFVWILHLLKYGKDSLTCLMFVLSNPIPFQLIPFFLLPMI